MIAFAAIAPHGDVDAAPELRAAMDELGRRFAASGCEAVVVVTPHNVHVEGHFAVVTAGRVGEHETDRALAARSRRARSASRGLPVVGVSYGGNDPAEAELPLDWGTEVPLQFVRASRVVVVAPARDRPLDEHVRLGEAIAAAPARGASASSRAPTTRTRTTAEGPYGFDPAAAAYDARFLELLGAEPLDFRPLARARRARRRPTRSGSCSCSRAPRRGRAKLLAYAAPTYYGMAVATRGAGCEPSPYQVSAWLQSSDPPWRRNDCNLTEVRLLAGAARIPGERVRMPRQKRKRKLRPKTPSRVKKRTKKAAGPRSLQHPELWGLGLVALGLFLGSVIYAGWNGGYVGGAMADGLDALIGGASWVVPVAFVAVGGLMVDAERARRRAPVPRRPRRRLVRPDGRRSAGTRAAISARLLGGAVGVAIGATGSTILGVLLLLVGALLLSGASLGAILRRSRPPGAPPRLAKRRRRSPPRRPRPGTSRRRRAPRRRSRSSTRRPRIRTSSEPRARSRRRRS